MNLTTDLKIILTGIDVLEIRGDLPERVTGIAQDSRRIKPGWLFAARLGEQASGLAFAGNARARGAVALMTDAELPAELPLPALRVKCFRPALARLSQAIYGDPSRKLKLLGITGTNGKTTTIHLLKGIVEARGGRCGLIGTVGYDTGARLMDASLTTPDIDLLSDLLAEMVDAGCDYAAVEVSSHALAQERVAGLSFAGAGFTNLTRDHLDYHQSFEEYAAAKARLFQMMESGGVAVINSADAWGETMAEAARGRVARFSSRPPVKADVTVATLGHSANGGHFRLTISGDSWLAQQAGLGGDSGRAKKNGPISFEVVTPLVGLYHGENMALAAALMLGLGFSVPEVQRGIAAVKSVPGRLEAVRRGQPFAVFVDYSHTPDALQSALKSLRPLCPNRLTVVFGCGGNRDREKRPLMGRIAAELADTIVITSDNPRQEKPAEIIAEIRQGVPPGSHDRIITEVDRRTAIRTALEKAEAGDAVLIAGKGHETYQETAGVRRPFDDRAVAGEALQEMGYQAVGQPRSLGKSG